MKTKHLLAAAAFIAAQASAFAATPVAETSPSKGVSTRPAAGLNSPATPGMGTANPGLTVAYTKITKLEVPATVPFGQPLVAKVYGAGNEAYCESIVNVLKADTAGAFKMYKSGVGMVNTGSWPRIATIDVTPGQYRVEVTVFRSATKTKEQLRCDEGVIAGNNSLVFAADAVAK